VLLEIKHFAEAEKQLTKAFEGFRIILGDEHTFTQNTLRRLIELYDAWGKPEKGTEYRAMLVEEPEQSAKDGQ